MSAPLGDRLELLFDQLVRAGLALSPRDRINASALVADVLARGEVTDFSALRPWLAPVLARSPADRERFFQVFDTLDPRPVSPSPGPDPIIDDTPARFRRVWIVLGFALLLGATVLAWVFWPKPEVQRSVPAPAPVPAPSIAAPKLPETVATPPTTFEILNRVAEAAERFEGAPTLEELGRELFRQNSTPDTSARLTRLNAEIENLNSELDNATHSPGTEQAVISKLADELTAKQAQLGNRARIDSLGWPAASYTIRLSELSGLPRTVPLALYGPNGKDGRVWAMIALALERIEHPGQEPTFAELLTAANETLAKSNTPRPVYELAQRFPPFATDLSEARMKAFGLGPLEYVNHAKFSKHDLIEIIQEAEYRKSAGPTVKPTPGELIDPVTVERALAIVSDPQFRRYFADAPWMPRVAPAGAPWWAARLAAGVPLIAAFLWFANSLAIRKAYLRRRPPQLPPLHLDLVSEAASRVTYQASLFQRIAQKLRLRTSIQTQRLDIEASIAATIAGGGEMPLPVYEVSRPSPEYLVLIERQSAADQDALRLRALVQRLEAMVPLTVYTYRSEPSRLEPEAGGRSVSIEYCQATYPQHRLLVLGSGKEFLDPATLKPHAGVAKFGHWPQRALLTPFALAEWGQEEFALAHELKMPIGRATPEGLLALAELLRLEGSDGDELIDTRGDGRARPLPEVLRVRPQRFLYATPPSDRPVPQIVQDLRNFLDGPSFDWLCALAVYPAIQWDLTLFLGVSLPSKAGGDARARPLYSEERIAALTQLPWLREGMMPNWLRAALIAELHPERASEIRDALKGMIDAAQLSGDTRRDDAVKLRIAQEPSKEQASPNKVLEDEVLLDFLARGRIEDYALPNASLLERFLPRSLLDRFGIPELAAGLVAVAYTVAVFWLAPRPADGALVTGAWLPLATLAVGAGVVLTASSPRATYGVVREALLRTAPIWLTTALLGTLWLGVVLRAPYLSPTLGVPELMAWISEHIFIAVSLIGLIAVVSLHFLAPLCLEFLGVPRSMTRPSRFMVLTSLVAIVACAHFADIIYHSFETYRSLVLGLLFSLVLFAVIFARFLPERLAPPKPLPRGTKASWSAGALRTAFALAPIIPAAWLAAYVANSNIKLPDIPGGATAIAELPGGGLIALGGADGRVRIIDTRHKRAERIEPIDTGGLSIASLALRRDRDDDANSPITLAVSTADGRVLMYDAKGGKAAAMPPAFTNVRGAGSKVHVALGVGGQLVAAVEDDKGETRLVSAGGEVQIPDSGPVTAFVAAGPGLFAVATLDGRVRLVKADGPAPPVIMDSGDAWRLPGRARELTFDTATSTLTALDDSSSVLIARIGGGAIENWRIDQGPPLLSLGKPVAWKGRSVAQIDPALLITAERLQRFAPRPANARVQAVYDSLASGLTGGNEQLHAAGINANSMRLCSFLGNAAAETGGFSLNWENMNYSANRLVEMFPAAKISSDEAARLAHKPEEIAERVYGLGSPRKARELGNTQPGDGWRYRGGGYLQTTGRAFFRALGQRIGFDLEAKPELLEVPATNLAAAIAEWNRMDLNAYADNGDFRATANGINMGNPRRPADPVGYDDRLFYFQKCLSIWGNPNDEKVKAILAANAKSPERLPDKPDDPADTPAEAAKAKDLDPADIAGIVSARPPDVALDVNPVATGGYGTIIVSIADSKYPKTGVTVFVSSVGKAEVLITPKPVALPDGFDYPRTGYKPQSYQVPLYGGTNTVRVRATNEIGESEPRAATINLIGEGALDKRGTLRVLAIGIDKYPGANKVFHDLKFAGADATSFADAAVKRMGPLYAKTDVTVLTNGGKGAEPTKANIEAALARVEEDASDTDTLVVFFAGYGEAWKDGHYHVMATDLERTSSKEPGVNFVDWGTIQGAVTRAKGRRLVFLDAPYSAKLAADAVADRFVVFQATSSNQAARELDEEKHGAFTAALIDGLSRAVDPKQQAVTVYRLGAYISEEVAGRTGGKQTPEYQSGQGNFALAR